MYDNMVEYWVTVREHGAYEEEHEIMERKKSTRKATFLSPSFRQTSCILYSGNFEHGNDGNYGFGTYPMNKAWQADEAVEIAPGTFGQVKALMDRSALDGGEDANKELPDGKIAEAGLQVPTRMM